MTEPSRPLDEHVETVAALVERAEQKVGPHQRFVERTALSLGRPATLYALVLGAATWVALNGYAGKAAAWDPAPFYWLQGFLGMYAALVSTIVLTAQNRQRKHSDHKAHLDLQLNLSAEHKSAKIIALLEELRRDLPSVRNRRDEEAERLSQSTDASAVMSALEETVGSRR